MTDHKKDFPIFFSRPHIYLDSAATSHKPQMVIDAVSEFYTGQYGTVRRGLYRLSSEATQLFESTRSLISDFIGAPDPAGIIFTSGTTESINLVAHAYLRPVLRPGDEIIISILEHHANLLPWQQLAKEKEAKLIILPLDATGDIDMDTFRKHLNIKTRMVAISHISNVTGGINPVKEIIAIAHGYNAKVLIDGAQSVSHLPVNVSDLDCDFFAFSGHKIYGPTGTGVLYGKPDLLNAMPPYRYGGEMVLEATNEYASFKQSPHRFEAGTPNIAGVIGMGAAIRFLQSTGIEQIRKYEYELTSYLVESLNTAGIKIVGNPKKRSSLVSFLVDDVHPHDVATLLDNEGIAVRAGHHCAQPLMRYLNVHATVRASLGWYNDRQDIDRLMAGIEKVRKIMQ